MTVNPDMGMSISSISIRQSAKRSDCAAARKKGIFFGKKTERVSDAQTEVDIQLPECIVLPAVRDHTPCFLARAEIK